MFKKNNIKFQHRINRVQAFVALKKSYCSYMVPNGDTFYMKVVALDEIYNFLVLGFCI
jgi:multisubunit Na+/H+ antiporter MnhF subunit